LSDSVPITSFTPEQVAILEARAIDELTALTAGVRSVPDESALPAGAPDYWTVENGYLPGLLFTYRSPDGHEELQLRPDIPVTRRGENGKVTTAKYVFAKGALSVLHTARVLGGERNVLIVEGTCQALAAAVHAPPGWAVYGIAGCQSWMRAGVPMPDLGIVDGRRVVVILDADGSTNRNVYDAGERLGRALRMNGAEEVRFARLAAGGKAGLDDVLGGVPLARRSVLLANIVRETCEMKPGEKPGLPSKAKPAPKKRSDEDGGEGFFDGAALLVEKLAQDIVNSHPIALTADNKLALYRDGVYGPGEMGVLSACTERLGDAFRLTHAANVEGFMTGEAARLGWRLPERLAEPLLNLENGMLDLRTGELKPHDAEYRSTVQFPVAWDPDAKAPAYEAWLLECAGAGQVDDLEESISVMLDPTITPSKAVFLFGPSRSGKSTMLKLMKEVAGGRNTSGVSLHQLVENRFMAARVFGKALNISADLSAAHLDDISIFKLMTGEDVVEADAKFAKPFTFTNRALFAFSANELPTVGESSRAYSERIRPFLFGNSFAGAEDLEMWGRLVAELPGILVRWVAAYRRLVERGGYRPTDAGVRETFEIESDRVRKWFAERLEVVPGDGEIIDGGMTKKELTAAFKAWADEGNGPHMTMSKVVARLLNLPLVANRRDGGRGKVRVLNVRIRPEPTWGIETNRTEAVAKVAIPNHSAVSENGDSTGVSDNIDFRMADSAKNLPLLPPPPVAASPAGSRILNAIQESLPEQPSQLRVCGQCGQPLVLVLDHIWQCPDRHQFIPRS
jgi:putative DNA primase/helicase